MASDEIANIQFRLRGADSVPPRFGPGGEAHPERSVTLLRARPDAAPAEGNRQEDARPDGGTPGFQYPSPQPSLPQAPVPPSELPEIETQRPARLAPRILGTDGSPPPPSDRAEVDEAVTAAAPGIVPTPDGTAPAAAASSTSTTVSETAPEPEPAATRLDERAVGTLVLTERPARADGPGPAVNEFLAGDVVDVRA